MVSVFWSTQILGWQRSDTTFQTPPEREDDVLLGQGSSFEGVLLLRGQARIDGSFSGKVRGEGKLVVGRHGNLEADFAVDHADIGGQVVGEVIAARGIVLRSTCKFQGTIKTPTLAIEEGAVFEGNCKVAAETGTN